MKVVGKVGSTCPTAFSCLESRKVIAVVWLNWPERNSTRLSLLTLRGSRGLTGWLFGFWCHRALSLVGDSGRGIFADGHYTFLIIFQAVLFVYDACSWMILCPGRIIHSFLRI